MKKTKTISLPDRLYLGMLDGKAKSLINKIVVNEGYLILTDVYAPHFAHYACMENMGNRQNWGLVEVKTEFIDERKLLPFHGYVARKAYRPKTLQENQLFRRKALEQIKHTRITWQDSLNGCGTVIYGEPMPIEMITKIVTFDPYIRDVNCSILDKIVNLPGPWDISKDEHIKKIEIYRLINDWFFHKDVCDKEWLTNNNGKDIYFRSN